MGTTPKLLVIVGETASGKSDLAIELALHFNGEIVAADSWTVYKDFTIGTAKPTKTQRHKVVHHLLDIADPHQGFSAAEFKKQASLSIDAITNRGKLPILVGGSGLYIDSIIYNYGFLPAGTPQERQRLSALSIKQLLEEAAAKGLDISTIDIRNKRRIIRLIEVKGEQPTRSLLRDNTLIIGLVTPKEMLNTRIIDRVEAMFKSGLTQEVAALVDRYGWDVEPMKGIGYREFRPYFEGKESLQTTKEAIIRDSLQLAKKQRTWFKRNKSIQWLQESQQATTLVQNFLSK